MAGYLETELIKAFNAMKEDLRQLILAESPFRDGLLEASSMGTGTADGTTTLHGDSTWGKVVLTEDVSGILPGANGGTGVVNSGKTLTLGGNVVFSSGGTFDPDGHTLTLTATTVLNGTPAAASHTHAAGDITSGTLAGAVGGTGVNNSGKTITLGGNLNLSSGGTIALNGHTLTVSSSTTLNGTPAAASHTHATGDITSGTMATARLGSGTASAGTLLHGDSTWSAIDLGSEVTATLLGANGGTGVNNSGKTLTLGGNVVFGQGGTINPGGFTLTVPATGTVPLGTGSGNRVVYWTGTNTQGSDANFSWDAGSNLLTLSSGFLSTGTAAWSFGGFTSTGDTATNGYVTVNIAGSNRRLATVA